MNIPSTDLKQGPSLSLSKAMSGPLFKSLKGPCVPAVEQTRGNAV